MVDGRQSRRFLKSVEDKFLVQVIDGPTQGEALLDLVLTNAEESIREVKIGGSLGCSDPALVEFVILKNAGLAKSRARTLCFRRAKFWLPTELLSGIPWENVLKGMGTEQSWQLFKDTLLRVQELSITQQKKLSRGGRRPAWLCKDLQLKLREKREMYRKWKQSCVAWEEYRAVHVCRDRIRKARA